MPGYTASGGRGVKGIHGLFIGDDGAAGSSIFSVGTISLIGGEKEVSRRGNEGLRVSMNDEIRVSMNDEIRASGPKSMFFS